MDLRADAHPGLKRSHIGLAAGSHAERARLDGAGGKSRAVYTQTAYERFPVFPFARGNAAALL
jgi:hypothetical protein